MQTIFAGPHTENVAVATEQTGDIGMAKGVELIVTSVEKETPKALCVILATGQEIWMPKSQIERGSAVKSDGDKGVMLVSEWIAKEKGLFGDADTEPGEPQPKHPSIKADDIPF